MYPARVCHSLGTMFYNNNRSLFRSRSIPERARVRNDPLRYIFGVHTADIYGVNTRHAPRVKRSLLNVVGKCYFHAPGRFRSAGNRSTDKSLGIRRRGGTRKLSRACVTFKRNTIFDDGATVSVGRTTGTHIAKAPALRCVERTRTGREKPTFPKRITVRAF